MKSINIALLLIIFSLNSLFAQEVEPTKRTYLRSAGEIIFSNGILDIPNVSPVVRFSMFFHINEQYHIDLNNNVGFYTGLGLRNVGMINRLGDSIRLKQRVYSLGIPLALKIGNIKSGKYFAIGGEAEFFFNYKQKTFLNGRQNKIDKFNEWFSNRVNLFNPSVFAEYHFKGKRYIRLKYYLNDFLVAGRQSLRVAKDAPYGVFTPEQSTLFYISVGSYIRKIR